MLKLAACGIADNLYNWIDNFLSRRTQQTRVGTSLSDTVSLSSGVVQGSVLGPLLFLLYINDVANLFDCDRCSCKMYADDVKLYTALSTADDVASFQTKLDALYRWSNEWQLNISSSKCAFMVVRDSNIKTELQLNGKSINKVNEYKDLGVIVDKDLKFTSHINHIVASANTRACLIRKCFLSRDVRTLIHAFNTYVRPLLE